MNPAQLKAARKKRGETCQQFAKRIGVNWRTLQGWEQGRKQSQLAQRILRELGT